MTRVSALLVLATSERTVYPPPDSTFTDDDNPHLGRASRGDGLCYGDSGAIGGREMMNGPWRLGGAAVRARIQATAT